MFVTCAADLSHFEADFGGSDTLLKVTRRSESVKKLDGQVLGGRDRNPSDDGAEALRSLSSQASFLEAGGLFEEISYAVEYLLLVWLVWRY